MINLISNRRQSLDPLRTSWVRPPASSVGHPLIFSVTESLLTGDCLLQPDPDAPLAPTAWQQLAESVAHEKSLTPFPAAVLYRRWQQGLAAVAVHQGCIIGHISCMPIFHQTTRSQVERALRGDQPQGASVWPAIEMFELLTGWTHPDWRRRKLSLHLRQHLLAQFRSEFLPRQRFFVSVTVGRGGSPVLARLGWHTLAWDAIPYVSSMIGANDDGRPRPGWHVTNHAPYNGSDIAPLVDTARSWDHHCFLWVSHAALAQQLNDQLQAAVGHDLDRWRRAWRDAALPTLLQAGYLPVLFG